MQPDVQMPLTNAIERRRRYSGDTLVGAPKPAPVLETQPEPTSALEARLVDAFANAAAEAKKAEAASAAARKELLAYAANARTKLRSNRYLVTISEQARTSLDTDAIKREMPADWLAARSKTSLVNICKVVEL